ncbi:TIGR03915 family putative DNA repair protein [Dysgonomonas sp. BGC7]|uniref:TIGR03915 family putative DNA repair protein n=1 Tax=Dysgonomonas sp. BGC7 TaxID=1658008 RepID=UPI0006825854|nr:TIGR03915 family putative DNA repair protein [Dysgonomonas sp. BGC7]MBD8388324.1 TIGR03915 family putative DNA repair protein [Dysgonomonas sp. BGC7]
MIVFFYDKTFEGLLTAVFDAYSRKVFPDKLLGEEDIPPLFMQESYTVITQEDRSARVWAALEKKMSKLACNMLSYAWLSEEEGSDELLFRYIRKTIDSKISIETNFADDDVLKLHQLAKRVAHEAQYLRQFVRFQKAADDIFFSPVSPRYNALPIAIEHFKDRFADQKWVIYDIKRRYGYYYDLHTMVEMTLDSDEHLLGGKLDENLMAEDEKMFQELWKGYFKSMTIKERINLKLQRQHMPKRFWKYLTEKQ